MAEEERPDRLVVRRVMPATRGEVFAAWTDPASIRDWMCPGDTLTAEAELDLRVGGAYRVVMKKPEPRLRAHGRISGRRAPLQARVHLVLRGHGAPADPRHRGTP